MFGFDILVVITACAAATVEATSASLPIVDLGYAVQQATLNVGNSFHISVQFTCVLIQCLRILLRLYFPVLLFVVPSYICIEHFHRQMQIPDPFAAGYRNTVLQFQQHSVRRSSGGQSTVCTAR
jgi:hypothetical protein